MSEAQSAAQNRTGRTPVERKVKAATLAVYMLCAVALAVINTVQGDPTILGTLPAWVEPLVVPILPALAAFLAGYQAKHTPR